DTGIVKGVIYKGGLKSELAQGDLDRAILERFKVGDRLSMKKIKEILQEIYDNLGLDVTVSDKGDNTNKS
ncbi:MAG: hypothetical protein MJ088_01860, partial [Clostridia bacterium]|nr:hypothetical protein [Clostridia bacterium]